MYQYHGWVVISESTGDETSNERDIKVFESIKKFIEDLQPKVDVLEMKAINGQYHLWMTGLWNREPSAKFHTPIASDPGGKEIHYFVLL